MGGTLDPLATGVVAVFLGQATRVMEYLLEGTKDYRAVIELGADTDTYDALGQVTGRKDYSHVTLSEVERSLESFEGQTQQLPPMYSALKKQGKRLYELARAGIEVEREPRNVEVFRVELVELALPLATVEVSCGRGFYMRSFAHDLGLALDCGGHLKSLVRLRSGAFEIADAIALSKAEQMFADGTWQEAFHAPDTVLSQMQAVIVGGRLEGMIRHGRPLPPILPVPVPHSNERSRVYTVDGRFVGIITFNATARQWRPEKVFSLSYHEAPEPP